MESLLEEITVNTIYSYLIVFCRVGSMFTTIPGIGEVYVAVRSRLLMALAVSIVISPAVLIYVPKIPDHIATLFSIIFIEVTIGIFYGILVRILINSLHTAGFIISAQSGLSAALFFDPNQGAQATSIGSLYTTLAITLFLSTNLHHSVIQGLLESFQTLQPGVFINVGDFTSSIIDIIGKSFSIAFKISAPVVIIAFLVLTGAGILSRLMPGMQVFFVLTPIQILICFFVILSTISATMMWYLNLIGEYLSNFYLGK